MVPFWLDKNKDKLSTCVSALKLQEDPEFREFTSLLGAGRPPSIPSILGTSFTPTVGHGLNTKALHSQNAF
ncbi:hypothetical protein O3G_MSEX003394 [Manduca sexta]|uniref:Uncharacterized protein n=1 Tax=Manduca sexta TaxID=7130 RepID=A0A922CFP8_MANSE|nr:hypothetical protein O3G_MSEX003394 [Manduca sexta]